MSLGLIATLLSVPGEPVGEAEAQSAQGENAAAGQGEGSATATNEGVSQFTVAEAPSGLLAASTVGPSEVEANAAAAQGGAAVAALPNQLAPNAVAAGRSGVGEPEEAEIEGTPAKPQPVPTAVAQFIAELDTSFVKARVRARRGVLFGPLGRAEGGEPSARMLAAVLAHWLADRRRRGCSRPGPGCRSGPCRSQRR